jgi:hypothetical protein
MRIDQKFAKLFGDALGAYNPDSRRHNADGFGGGRFDSQLEAGSDADSSKHAQFIFLESLPWIANRAENARLKIVLAADVVDQSIFQWIEKHAVNREIAEQCILSGR